MEVKNNKAGTEVRKKLVGQAQKRKKKTNGGACKKRKEKKLIVGQAQK
jgi:hypothetical protein